MPSRPILFPQRGGPRRRDRQGKLYVISEYSLGQLQTMLANHQKWAHDFARCAGCRKLQDQIKGQQAG